MKQKARTFAFFYEIMDLTGLLTSAENQYKQILEDYFISIYDEKQLPSHGIDHHRRVWKTAKELVLILGEKDLIKDKHLIPSLLLSCYLHDLGMATDHGPRHGRHSLEFASRFLYENNLGEDDFPGMLQAVLAHDNKDYFSPGSINVQTLLSVADDLDAFGFIGIYRYTEIYYLRGINPDEMGSRIRENALQRFRHFEELFRNEAHLINKHRKRFKILDDFFRSSDTDQITTKRRTDRIQILEILIEMINAQGVPGEIAMLRKEDKDPAVKWFFENLNNELESL